MKILFALVLISSAFAQDKSFEEKKKSVLDKVDTHIADWQVHRTCVSKAKTDDELEACKNKLKKDRRERKESFEKKHKRWVDERSKQK